MIRSMALMSRSTAASLQVSALGVDPAADKGSRVFAKSRVKGVTGAGVRQGLHDESDLIV